MENLVREKREYYGFSQRDLAEKVGYGASTISEIENGKHDPGVPLAILLARELNSTVEELFGGGVK